MRTSEIAGGGAGLRVLGVSEIGPRGAVCLGAEDGRFHNHVICATGSGKSTLLAKLTLAHMAAGRGVAVDHVVSVFARSFARDLLGSATSSFSMADVLDGGVLLARLPKGLLGEDTARLVGSLLVARVWQAATARNKVYFNASPEDARVLARHTEPYVSAYDLSHLGANQVACRLVVGGQDLHAFTLRTRPVARAVPGRAAEARTAARANAGRTRDERRYVLLVRRRQHRRNDGGGSPGVSTGVPGGVSSAVLETPGSEVQNHRHRAAPTLASRTPTRGTCHDCFFSSRRGAVSALDMLGRLTERDRLICRVLWEHRILTTEQICDLYFTSLVSAQHRLVTLWRLGVLERFRSIRPVGSESCHYTLGPLGTGLVAAGRVVVRAAMRCGVGGLRASRRVRGLGGGRRPGRVLRRTRHRHRDPRPSRGQAGRLPRPRRGGKHCPAAALLAGPARP
jgi:hypothetical protein